MNEKKTTDQDLYLKEKALQSKSESIYFKIMVLGFIEFFSWVLCLATLIFAFFNGSLILPVFFLIVSSSIDIFVLKKYKNKKEFFEVRSDIISFIKSFKIKK